MAKHKFNIIAYGARKQVKTNLKADTGKKTTVPALADRVAELEKIIGVRTL